MELSRESVEILIDIVQNRMEHMQISDREELREAVLLQRCLKELRYIADAGERVVDTPIRGRRRKLASLMNEANIPQTMRKKAS
ncbi:MAG: hypothetical protein EOM37_08405 [Proteobacteria bacterium]|nr:hypothetical protein [Pseudomonadota bacterium]